jgi:hypothetical protein
MTGVIPWEKELADVISKVIFKNTDLMYSNLSSVCNRDLTGLWGWVKDVELKDYVEINLNLEVKIGENKRIVRDSTKEHIRIGDLLQEHSGDRK